MKMRELFDRIDRSGANRTDPDIELWARQFEITVPWGSDADEKLCKRMRGYWAVKWYCTDTWVGMVLYFLDGEPLAMAIQTARKNSVDVSFVSKEMAFKLRDLLYELCRESTPDDSLDIIDMDEEVGETYTVNYGSQLLVSDGLYNDKPAKVIKTFDGYDQIDAWRSVVVKTEQGEQTINMDEFHIPYPTKENT